MTRFRIHDLAMPGVDAEEEITSTIFCETHDFRAPEGSGGDRGRLMVCLGIDDAIDGVYADLGPTDQIAALQRAIAALGVVESNLRAVYEQMGADRGQCLGVGYDDECRRRAGHDGDCGPQYVKEGVA